LLNTVLASLSEGVTPSTTAYESIATVTVGSGGLTNVDFTSIPSTYTHLQIRGTTRSANASNTIDIRCRFNSESATNYDTHWLYGNGSSAVVDTAITTNKIESVGITSGASAGVNIFGVFVIDILDYTNVNKNKTVRTLTGHDNNGSGTVGLISGLWRNTLAINSIRLFYAVGDFAEYSQVALYGIKGA
jgi:hypothetical protein